MLLSIYRNSVRIKYALNIECKFELYCSDFDYVRPRINRKEDDMEIS